MKTIFPTRQNAIPAQFETTHTEETFTKPSVLRYFEAATDEITLLLLSAVVGVDQPPRRMNLTEVKRLGDVFSQKVLLQGRYPLTLQALIESIESIDTGSAFPKRRMFVVAEGAQFKLREPNFELNARLVFTWQRSNALPPDLMLSTVADTDNKNSLLQLIAWSEKDGSFHFFERKNNVWGWAGNSFLALRPPSRGLGPFDSHINGGLVMKELKFPWTHWHSMSNSIPREVFGTDSEFNTHPLFSRVDGAEELEQIVRTGVRRWTKSRIESDFKSPLVKNVRDYFRQIVTPTAANLVSSSLEYRRIEGKQLFVPSEFLFDRDGLEMAALAINPLADVIPVEKLMLDGTTYKQVAERLLLHVPSEDGQVKVSGDTHFCFLVPERAFEDFEVAKQMVERKIISPKFLLCLLMVDFPNPLESPRRAKLLDYCPETIQQTSEQNLLEKLFLSAIQSNDAINSSPEVEFLSYWNEPDIILRVSSELRIFFQGIQDGIVSDAGLEKLHKLAEFRKSRFRNRDLDEFNSTTSWIKMPLASVTVDKSGNINVLNNGV